MRRDKEGDQSVWRVRVSQMNGGLVLTRNTIAPVSDLLVHWQVNTALSLIYFYTGKLTLSLIYYTVKLTQSQTSAISAQLALSCIMDGSAGEKPEAM